ncbi:MAG: hypothetical protein Q9184_001487 [Pyrenodesmia sp. 2 TL-2023]
MAKEFFQIGKLAYLVNVSQSIKATKEATPHTMIVALVSFDPVPPPAAPSGMSWVQSEVDWNSIPIQTIGGGSAQAPGDYRKYKSHFSSR